MRHYINTKTGIVIIIYLFDKRRGTVVFQKYFCFACKSLINKFKWNINIWIILSLEKNDFDSSLNSSLILPLITRATISVITRDFAWNVLHNLHTNPICLTLIPALWRLAMKLLAVIFFTLLFFLNILSRELANLGITTVCNISDARRSSSLLSIFVPVSNRENPSGLFL